MRVAFIGDVVGKPGRLILSENLANLRKRFSLDFVIANYENASHGFGLSKKNCKELFSYGIDCMTGGNHSFDKKDILQLFKDYPLLRPINYPDSIEGNFYKVFEINNESLAVISAMGVFCMPSILNPFLECKKLVIKLKKDGVQNIFLDFHAEATAEKRIMFKHLQNEITAIIGTHTHIGTDDLEIEKDTLYLTDVGLTGKRSTIIGMEIEEPLQRALNGISARFDIKDGGAKILQMVVMDIEEGKCIDAFKYKLFCNNQEFITKAFK